MAQMNWDASDAKTRAQLEARLKAALEQVATATHESVLRQAMGARSAGAPGSFSSAGATNTTWREVKPAEPEKPAPGARSGIIMRDFHGMAELWCTNVLGQRVPLFNQFGDIATILNDPPALHRALSTLTAMDKLP